MRIWTRDLPGPGALFRRGNPPEGASQGQAVAGFCWTPTTPHVATAGTHWALAGYIPGMCSQVASPSGARLGAYHLDRVHLPQGTFVRAEALHKLGWLSGPGGIAGVSTDAGWWKPSFDTGVPPLGRVTSTRREAMEFGFPWVGAVVPDHLALAGARVPAAPLGPDGAGRRGAPLLAKRAPCPTQEATTAGALSL